MDFETYQQAISPQSTMEMGKELYLQLNSIEQKKAAYAQVFSILFEGSIEDTLLNMWAIGSMLEDEGIGIAQKIAPFRDCLTNEDIKDIYLNDWVTTIFQNKRPSTEMLEFIAIDVRNNPRINEELKKRLFAEYM